MFMMFQDCDIVSSLRELGVYKQLPNALKIVFANSNAEAKPFLIAKLQPDSLYDNEKIWSEKKVT